MSCAGLADLKGGVTGGSAKDSMIRGLAADLAKELKVKGIKTSGETSEIVQSMIDSLPDPRASGNGKSFTDKEKAQVEACKKLAKIVNKHLGEGTVSTDANPGEQCEQITEAMYTLSQSSRNELGAVKKDAERVISNLKSLETMIKSNYGLLVTEISKSEDNSLGVKTVVLEQTQKALLEEVERQLGLLARIVDVQLPKASKDIAAVLKDNKEFKTLVRKIKAEPGTAKFGERVALTISGIGRTAAEAEIVAKALHDMGMTVDEYAKLQNFDELRTAVSKSLQDNLSEKSAEKLEDWLKASSYLYRYFHDHDKIVEEMKASKKATVGGGSETKVGGLKLEKSIEKRKVVREGLLNAFNRRMSSYIEQVMLSTESLAEGVGAKRIPVSDDLVKFTKTLDIVPSLDNRANYYALSGYNNTVEAKQLRETFLGSVKHLLASIEKLQKNKDYSGLVQLRDMHAAWTGFSKLVRDFSTRFAEGFGAIVPKPGVAAEGGDEKPLEDMTEKQKLSAASNNNDAIMDGGAIDAPELARVAYNLTRTKNVIKYYVRTGLIQMNMQNVAAESKEYSKDYTKILADAIANLRDVEANKANDKKENLDKAFKALSDAEKKSGDKEKELKVQKETLDFFSNADDKMFLVAEVIDTYLMHFTDSLVAHPNDIESLHTMLRTTDTLSKWYSEKSGNLVCAVFESYAGKTGKSLVDSLKTSKEHYYTLLKSAPTPVTATLNVVTEEDGKTFKQLMKDTHNAFDNVLALKNIMSAFFHIGDKFGGELLRKKVHMRPVEIYNALVDYMAASSHVYDDAGKQVGLDRLMASRGTNNTAPLLFEYCVKGIVAKILTVIGTYNMLNRPINTNGIGYSSDMRMTLGAGEMHPAVHEDAMELYIRMPLLAEWYRETFQFFAKTLENKKLKKPTPDVGLTLSMIPEVDGLYSGLVNLIFMQSRNLGIGIYSETESRTLVNEINKIYSHHKSAKDPVMASIHGFVNEINRRYGILIDNERTLYKKEYNDRYNNLDKNLDYTDNINYAILPDGEETDVPRRSAPSDAVRIRTPSSVAAYNIKHKWNMGQNDKKMLDALRWCIGEQLKSAQPTPQGELENITNESIGFDGAVRARAEELKNASGEQKRFQLVVDAINAFGEFSYSSIERNVIMFHETVVLGLDVLNSMYEMCNQFNNEITNVYNDAKNNSTTPAQIIHVLNQLQLHVGCMSGLVNVRMESIATGADANSRTLSIHVDYSKLKEVVDQELAFVKSALDRFRGLVPKEILSKYENPLQPGTIYNLEDVFVNKLLYNRVELDNNDDKYLDSITRKLKEIFNKTKLTEADFKSLILNNGPLTQQGGKVTEMGLGLYLRDLSKIKKLSDDMKYVNNVDGVENHYMINLQKPELTTNAGEGVVVKFNQLLAMYLKQFSNEANERVYVSVINHVANSVFSKEVTEVGAGEFSSTVNDFAATDLDFRNSNVLAKSLAIVMYNLVNGKMSGQRELYYLESDMAEVPEFLREKYRASMPVFNKLFCTLAARCDTIKQMVKFVKPDTTENMKESNMLLTLDKVIAGCEAVCKCIKAVLGELTDDQVYFDTRQGFSKDYMSANGVAAFMPLSSLTFLLNDTSIAGKTYMPNKFPGTTEFKMLYGVRGVLCGETSMKFVPGMKDILARHNESSDAEHHMTEAEIAGHVQCSLQFLRYMIDAKHIAAPIVNSSVISLTNNGSWASKQTELLKVITMTESTHQNEQRLEIVNHIGRAGQIGMIYGDRNEMRSKNIIDMNLTPININALRREMPLMNLYNYSYTFDRMICDLLEVGPEIIDTDNFDSVNTYSKDYAEAKYQNEGARKFLAWLTIHPYDMASIHYHSSVDSKSAPPTTPLETKSGPTPIGDGAAAPKGRAPKIANTSAEGGSPSPFFDNELRSIMVGLTNGVQGLGVPKFLADQLWGKVLLHDLNNNNPLTYNTANSPNAKDKRTLTNNTETALDSWLGYDRFNTRFVRHMFWMVNLQRLLRLKMSRDLMWHTTKITKDIAVLAPGNTETFGKEVPDLNEENYKY